MPYSTLAGVRENADESFTISFKVPGRCPMSGYPEEYAQDFTISMADANALYSILSRKVPDAIEAAKSRQLEALNRREKELEAELKGIKQRLKDWS